MTRAEAAKIITVILDCCKGKEPEGYGEREIIPLEKSFKALGMAIEALEQEPKRGKWLDYLKEGLKWKCSECGSKYTTPWHYCPNCGARMETEQ